MICSLRDHTTLRQGPLLYIEEMKRKTSARALEDEYTKFRLIYASTIPDNMKENEWLKTIMDGWWVLMKLLPLYHGKNSIATSFYI